jgi:hypothetical protein
MIGQHLVTPAARGEMSQPGKGPDSPAQPSPPGAGHDAPPTSDQVADGQSQELNACPSLPRV